MAETKRYYWFKTPRDFIEGEIVDYFYQHGHGSDDVVIYEKLVCMAMESEGRLEKSIGEVNIVHTAQSITYYMRYFSCERIAEALALFQQLHLIATDENGVMYIVDFEKMVGTETDAAVRMRKARDRMNHISENTPCLQPVMDENDNSNVIGVTDSVTESEQCSPNVTPKSNKNGVCGVTDSVTESEQCSPNVTTEIRDIEIRVSKKENKKRKSAASFDEMLDKAANGDPEVRGLLGEWMKVRKAKRLAMTDMAIQTNLDLLGKYAADSGLTIAQYLREAVRRSWGAFYEIPTYNVNAREKPPDKRIKPVSATFYPQRPYTDDIDADLAELMQGWKPERSG